MNRAELTERVKSKCDLTPIQAEKAIDALFGVIESELSLGEKVQVAAFGRFEPKIRSARKTMNPRTRETMTIPEKTAATFRASKTLKDNLT